MTNTAPVYGRVAIVQIDSTTVAYAQGYVATEVAEAVTEYVLEPSSGTGWPAVGASGKKGGTVEIDALYVDNTYTSKLEAGTAVSIIGGPVGSSSGNPKMTYSCIITQVQTTVKKDAYTVLKIAARMIAAPVPGTWT